MNADTLANCLTIGWSSRFNARDGIGRFGVGMTLGAIHECRKIEVWSKVLNGEWLYTVLDLDKIQPEQENHIPTPIERALPPEYKHLVSNESGTLVLWTKLDRQQEAADKIVEDFRIWCGRTFRHFIWKAIAPRTSTVEIEINAVPVYAIDPLYVETKNTAFENDPVAKLFEPIRLKWPIDPTTPNSKEGKEGEIRILISQLPEDFRQQMGKGGSKEIRERHIHLNEGVSILRNHREVFYGPIPYWKMNEVKGWASFDDIDRWWGAEIHFDAELDNAFQVKNIKQGAVPTKTLKTMIKQQLLPTRQTILEEVRELWARNAQAARDKERKKKKAEVHRAGEHEIAERTAKQAQVPVSVVDRGKDLDESASKQAGEYSDRYDKEEQQKLKELFKSQPFTVMESNWKGSLFFEPAFLGGNAKIDYNLSHSFWRTVYDLLDKLKDPAEDLVAITKELKAMIDILIIAHAKARSLFATDAEYTAGRLFEEFEDSWGQMLRSYVEQRIRDLENNNG
mgnify:CR=1 FL=1